MLGTPYQYLARDGEPRVGLLENLDPEVGNMWVSYIRVDDVAETVRRAQSLGGRIIVAPDPALRAGTVAIIADPNGAGVVLQRWSPQ